ncbi:neprilysin-4-like [Drosophila pseudoobscura]|uniref:Neprilysin-4-like n=1 Tax=Drosophila pseudoobscura pseudoobscura TaxID=46245 RepID=A0A6I8UPA7_DROPS|nr:neprilysin-4 [Drosophila pseudoobscura]
MRALHTIYLVGHVLCTLSVLLSCGQAAPAAGEEHQLNEDTPYMRELLRLAKAAEMKSFMNQRADPCTDFYAFACGNWSRINSAVSLSEYTTGLFETLTKALNRKLALILTSAPGAKDTREDIQVKHFYESCTRLGELKDTYAQKLKSLIAEFGSMPVLEGSSWQEADFDWLDTAARMDYRYGVGSILSIEVTKDFANNHLNRLYVGQQEFPLESRSMYLDNRTLTYRLALRDRMQRTMERFLGVEKELAKATAQELLDFEVDLARGLADESDGADIAAMTELMTVAEMHKRYAPTLEIERFVSVSMGDEVKTTDQIYEYNSDYQRNLIQVIQRTPKRVVANYIFYSMIKDFAVTAATSAESKKEMCIGLTKKSFAKNLDNMIYRSNKNDETARQIEDMWRQLKSTFNETLHSSQQLDWIDRPTRQKAIVKLEAMTLQVNSYADHNFTEEFAGLNLQSADYVENLRQATILGVKQMREELHQPAKPLEAGELLSYTPANILVENAIKVPVALLQPFYLWGKAYPSAIMFGSLAVLIGHELIHGFDDSGRKFDARGQFHDWWDQTSANNFLDRQTCFTEQYGGYVYDGIPLKKSVSQSENIADNGGVRLAYTAYRKWHDNLLSRPNSSEALLKETLPTMDYNSKQLFFISYGQVWCNDAHPRVKAIQVSTDQHVPGKFRVIGPLSNFDEFSKEFNCPVDSPMNPRQKCMLY